MAKKTIARILAMLLVTALLTAMPAALAEEGGEEVLGGYNPFDSGDAADTATSVDPYDNGANNAAIGTNTNADPFGTTTSADPVVNDPFGVGTAASVEPVVNDPFGVGVAAAATPMPEATIGGYNPFSATMAPSTPATQTNMMMFVTVGTVKMRRKPDDVSRLIDTATFGQQVNVTATQGEWAQVQTKKGKAYCRLSALSSADPNVLNKVMYAQLGRVLVYKNPSKRSGRVKTLRKGDTITMVAMTSDGLWARVTDGAKYGFVPSVYLDDSPAAQGTPVWCASSSTAVMINPENWIDVGTLSFGQQVFLVGYTSNNTVAKIRSGKGYVAYCDASALTTANPANLSTPVYAQVSGRILCKSASEKGKHFHINKNNKLTLLGIDSSQLWALVKQGRRKWYVPYIFLGNARSGNNYKVVVTNQDAPLYQGEGASSAVIATLPLGTRLYLTGVGAVGAKVTTLGDGVTQAVAGYVPLQYLRSE